MPEVLTKEKRGRGTGKGGGELLSRPESRKVHFLKFACPLWGEQMWSAELRTASSPSPRLPRAMAALTAAASAATALTARPRSHRTGFYFRYEIVSLIGLSFRYLSRPCSLLGPGPPHRVKLSAFPPPAAPAAAQQPLQSGWPRPQRREGSRWKASGQTAAALPSCVCAESWGACRTYRTSCKGRACRSCAHACASCGRCCWRSAGRSLRTRT